MLRTTANTLIKSTSWKNPAIFSSVKCYSTPVTETPAPAAEKKAPLSSRLGGTGRGKILADSTDPFASFLNNAKKGNNNRGPRNGSFTPRDRKPQAETAAGQFDDATEEKPKKTTQSPRKNNNQPRQNREGQKAEGTERRQNENRPNKRDNGANKRLALRKSQPQEVRTRRAVTFIDRDIDWSSFDSTTVSATESESVEQTEDNNELLLKEMQGDYARYLAVGNEIKWSDIVKGDTVSTLVGSNASYDLQQKTAFLNALSKATGAKAVARK